MKIMLHLSISLLVLFTIPSLLLGQEESLPEPAAPAEEDATAKAETGEEVVEEVEEEEETAETGDVVMDFDFTRAVFDSTDIFYSSEVVRIVKQCLIKWSHTIPLEISIIARISQSGKIETLEIREEIAPNSKLCMEKELASIPFAAAPKSYTVAARYDFEKSDFTGKKEVPEEPSLPEKYEGKDPDTSRVIYLQTANARGKGVFNFTTIWGGHLKLAYGISDNIDISFSTIVPVMVWGLGIFPKFSFQIHEQVRMALKLDFGFAWPYFVTGTDSMGFMYGGAPLMITAGNEDYFFNFSIHLEGITFAIWDEWAYEESGGTETETYFIVFPSIGASARIAKKVKFNLELWTLLTTKAYLKDDINGKVWGVMYGFRIFGKQFYGDINFVIPIFEGWWEIQRYVPIGYPMVAFGFNMPTKQARKK